MRMKLILAFSLLIENMAYGHNQEASSGHKALATTKYTEVSSLKKISSQADELLGQAMAILEKKAKDRGSPLQKAIATETLARLAEARVLLDSIDDPLPEDLYHMCRDLGHRDCPKPLENPASFRGTSSLRQMIDQRYEGYMWGNRIYVKFIRSLKPEELALTLVHEVNHVLNRSECHYYHDYTAQVLDPALGFLEEYRAFIAECAYRSGYLADAAYCHTYAEQELIDRSYTFSIDAKKFMAPDPAAQLSERLFYGSEFGELIPSISNWPESFKTCP
ncbi:MAG: hypothetical protein NTX25_19950 [Proteobacteria bacterium]|nr:hypothetical protein [Pseudomonadota bacterium]